MSELSEQAHEAMSNEEDNQNEIIELLQSIDETLDDIKNILAAKK